MPSYEMSIIYKVMERPELARAVRRTLDSVIEKGGIIKSLENVGVRKLPYKMFKHGERNDVGNYYLVKFFSPPGAVTELKALLGLDLQVIKRSILREEEMTSKPCDHRDCDFGELTPENRLRLREDLEKFVKKL